LEQAVARSFGRAGSWAAPRLHAPAACGAGPGVVLGGAGSFSRAGCVRSRSRWRWPMNGTAARWAAATGLRGALRPFHRRQLPVDAVHPGWPPDLAPLAGWL